ncbi:hypothetical protein [Arthrobacter sp.]|uniref:hypothetical protein n=1 Tax=Arthrobacter sp. TaxID=1667 RepID=UPI003A95590F
MLDPHEGLDAHGFITTGARRERVPAAYDPLLAQACSELSPAFATVGDHVGDRTEDGHGPAPGLYLYGSVATGQAIADASDVDLLTIGLPADVVAPVARGLSARHAGLCRAVEIGAAQPVDFVGPGDAAYGNRVFLRHYCVPLIGPDPSEGIAPFRGDRAAARGFNGDIGRCLDRWRLLAADGGASSLGRRIARKTLVAVAGLVSMHDATWTTDRRTAAERWGMVRPDLAPALAELAAWSEGTVAPTPGNVLACLQDDGVLPALVADFTERIGLWT